MSALEDRVRQQDPENAIISRLVHLTKWSTTSRFYGGDIDGAVAIIRTVTNRLQYLLQTESEHFHNKKSYIQEFFQNVLRIT